MKFSNKILNGKVLSSRVYPDFFPVKSSERIINVGCGDGPQAIVYSGSYQEMIGVDINRDRMERSKKIMSELDVRNYSTIYANVESIPLPSKSFDKALAIDIIEHVVNPEKFCKEIHRLLTDSGELLITFPAMHDRYAKLFSLIGRYILRRKKKEKGISGWNPDEHNHDYSLARWINLVSGCGFELKKSRATTMFPPLHLYGVPRFWFSNNVIYKIDSFFSRLPLVKNFGQSLVCIFSKK